MNWKSFNIPPTASELDSPHMGRALGRLLDLGLDSCFDQQVMEKSANTHIPSRRNQPTHILLRNISYSLQRLNHSQQQRTSALGRSSPSKEMAAQQRVLKTMEKGRRRQFRTTLDKFEHPRVRSNHSEIMETFGGKETELVLAIQQGEHLGGLQVSKGVPQGPTRSPRGPWLFNELVKCGAWESCGRAQQGRWWVNKKEAPLLNKSQLMLTSVSNHKRKESWKKLCNNIHLRCIRISVSVFFCSYTIWSLHRQMSRRSVSLVDIFNISPTFLWQVDILDIWVPGLSR